MVAKLALHYVIYVGTLGVKSKISSAPLKKKKKIKISYAFNNSKRLK